MSRDQTAWVFLFVFAIFLIVIGFQGNLGTTIGIIFSPQEVLIGADNTNVGGIASGTF